MCKDRNDKYDKRIEYFMKDKFGESDRANYLIRQYKETRSIIIFLRFQTFLISGTIYPGSMYLNKVYKYYV